MQRGARGIGAWLGALFHGFRGTAPEKVAREAATRAQANERALATARAAVLRKDAERTEQELHLTQARLAAVSESAANLGSQRDRLAQEVNRLRPDQAPGSDPRPRPR